MTHKYYYVSAGQICDENTRIYIVTLGQSLQGRRDYEFLRTYAIQHGHYFEKISIESDIFILNQSHLKTANYQLKMLDVSYRIISNLNRRAATTAKRSR